MCPAVGRRAQGGRSVQRVADIEDAIASHTLWLSHVRQAVLEAQAGMNVESIGAAERCDFGKWLYGPRLSVDDRASVAYRDVESLHAEFHRVAAQVVEFAAAGQTVEAYGLLYGEYVTTSGRLAIALRAWQESLAGQPGKAGANSDLI